MACRPVSPLHLTRHRGPETRPCISSQRFPPGLADLQFRMRDHEMPYDRLERLSMWGHCVRIDRWYEDTSVRCGRGVSAIAAHDADHGCRALARKLQGCAKIWTDVTLAGAS